MQQIEQALADFPPFLRSAGQVAFAIEGRAQFPKLEDRQIWLANTEKYSLRTARRRVDEACIRLAEVFESAGPERCSRDLERGWNVRQLQSLLCLDVPGPELYEQRTIVATRDRLGQIQTRFSLPPSRDGGRGAGGVIATVLHGARLERTERLGAGHFRCTLTLPRQLAMGEEHSYQIAYRLPVNQSISPHFAFLPLAPCDHFQVRIRFDPAAPPVAIWRLDRVAPRLLDDRTPGETLLTLDASGDLTQSFTDLVQGFGYGVGWLPAAEPRDRQRETPR